MTNNELPEWRKERIEMTHLMWKNVLDPLMTFAELVRGYDQEKGIDFTNKELSALLRLIILGGYTEPKLYCTIGGTLNHVSGDSLEADIRQWDGQPTAEEAQK